MSYYLALALAVKLQTFLMRLIASQRHSVRTTRPRAVVKNDAVSSGAGARILSPFHKGQSSDVIMV